MPFLEVACSRLVETTLIRLRILSGLPCEVLRHYIRGRQRSAALSAGIDHCWSPPRVHVSGLANVGQGIQTLALQPGSCKSPCSRSRRCFACTQVGVWYLSVIFLTLYFGVLILRMLIFTMFWIVGFDFWIFPNLNDELLPQFLAAISLQVFEI